MIQYQKAQKKDLQSISVLCAKAFIDNIIFAQTIGKVFKSKDDYTGFLSTLFLIQIKAFMRNHYCFTGKVDDRVVSAAILQRPDKPKVSVIEYLLSGALGLLLKGGLFNTLKLLTVLDSPQKSLGPVNDSSWYLELLVVDKAFQGQKLGTQMLNDCIKPCVKAEGGTQLTLITNTDLNHQFYCKNGFTVFAEKTIGIADNPVKICSYQMKMVK